MNGEDYEAAKDEHRPDWPGYHLPECPLATDCKHDYYDEPPLQCANCGEECICDRLRACEARCDAKRQAEVKAWSKLSRDNFDAGYAAGVQAARDAVANAPWDAENWIAHAQRAADLAAINALRVSE